MAAPQTFRSAFNGFNREDVVHYIEYINTQHTAQVNQLVSEAEFLRQKLAHLEAQKPDEDVVAKLTAEIESLTSQLKQKTEDCGRLEDRMGQLLQVQQELQERCDGLLERCRELENAPKVQHVSIEAELEAYRRAERTERLARERVEQLYHQANGTIADATVKVDCAAERIAELSQSTASQLSQLLEAVESSKQSLAEAKASLYCIRPETSDTEA